MLVSSWPNHQETQKMRGNSPYTAQHEVVYRLPRSRDLQVWSGSILQVRDESEGL